MRNRILLGVTLILLLAIGGLGNVRSTTLKALTEAEFRTITGATP